MSFVALSLIWNPTPASAQAKTKSTLTTEVNTNFPSNCTQCITAAILRATVIDIINSYTDGFMAALPTTTLATPTGTASTNLVMLGFGATCTATPQETGRLAFHFDGTYYFATAAATMTMAGLYGTGSAPSNGAVLTGTNAGSNTRQTVSGANLPFGYSREWTVTGLATGTQVWFDLAISTSSAADSLGLSNNQCSVREF